MPKSSTVLGFCLLAGAATAQEDAAFAADVRPVLRASCVSCHGGPKPKGDFDLAPAVEQGAKGLDAAGWRAVRARVAAHEMPPPAAKGAPLSPDARARFVAWIDADRKAAAAAPGGAPADPGRPTLRRLARREYAAALRDLLGVDVAADEALPPDDLGYGFDNVGAALTLPTVAFEKYAAVAERAAAEAIVDEDPSQPPTTRFEAENMDCELKPSNQNGFRVLYSNAAATSKFVAPRDGDYVLRARVCGDQAGPELPRVTFVVDGRAVGAHDVRETRREPKAYEIKTRLKKGARVVGASFTNDYFDEKHPDKTKRDRNLAVDWVDVVGPVDRLVPPPGHVAIFRGDDPRRPPEERAKKLLPPLLLRLWRRPATGEEVARLASVVAGAAKDGGRFAGGMRLALAAALTSPHFLFRIERDLPGSPPIRPLDGFELATRLSFFLWGSAPDDRLLARAAEKRAWDEADVAAEAERMLDDARASSLAEDFATQWLELRNLAEAAPDPRRYALFDEPLRAAMRREAELFFDAVLRERRSAWELLDADFTFVNEPLAKLYGVPGVRGPEFRRVALTNRRRGGVVGMAGVHTVTANPTRTSPVKRGKWLLENLLDAPPPPPPPGVGAFEEGKEPLAAATLRERMEKHRADPSCASCHVRMDALGFAMENYDPVGGWRDADGGAPVDATGALPDGRKIRGPVELKAVLRADDAFLRALTKKLLTYAVGRGLEESDESAVLALVAALPKDRPTLRDLVLGVVRLEAFRFRRTTP